MTELLWLFQPTSLLCESPQKCIEEVDLTAEPSFSKSQFMTFQKQRCDEQYGSTNSLLQLFCSIKGPKGNNTTV
eukprot:c11024_g1_i1 orf=55-276(+)